MKKLVSLFVVVIILMTGCSIKKESEVTDAEKFAVEYSVDEKNPFKYASIDEVLDIFNTGNGIVFFANSDNELCVEVAKILLDSLDGKNIEDVYYYNPQVIRDNNTDDYNKLIDIIEDYLPLNDNLEPYLFLPDVYFVRDGKIIGHNNDVATIKGTIDDILTEKRKKQLKNKYLELINSYNSVE